jgi:cyclopropane fatty-acyl-phospholipid synthase-like methyltransferase
MTNDQTQKSYDKIATEYVRNRDQFANKKYLDMLANNLQKGASILDVGCGAGLPVDKYLVEKGFSLSGIDISPRQIELAQKNIPEGFFEIKDMSKLQAYEYCVDAIVSFYAIFHIPREEHAALFKKFITFMPKGGYILVTMGANGEDPGTEEVFHGEKVFYSFYAPEKNTEIIKDAGFEILYNEIEAFGNEKHQIVLGKI